MVALNLENQQRACAYGGVTALIDLLREESPEARALAALSATALVRGVSEVKDRFLERGMSILCQALKAASVREAADSNFFVARGRDEEKEGDSERDIINRSDGAIVKGACGLVRDHGAEDINKRVRINCTDCLAALCSQNAAGRDAVRRHSSIPLILSMLSAPREKDEQRSAAGAVDQIIHCNAPNQAEVLRLSTQSQLVNLLRETRSPQCAAFALICVATQCVTPDVQDEFFEVRAGSSLHLCVNGSGLMLRSTTHNLNLPLFPNEGGMC